ncbi:3-deoxy-D-arabinoheptulosonate-7-phosphate synthase [Caldanaerobius fijiensis DSM 17918]|uniref:3-deoxy-D-arabinoheptulosonate-7-phosphate synthase n=1 Tax=Caldanaerobius fijiensis DSM 17918 TaxID=1121256 RepID=A0A1M5BEU2_9THEO|nr:3-deoxy-7-phosphoheptulonate synthase [Caldanaerobius fijiensis]SHF40925.1 3-deoxy-D-arabinoheptulosonate-7-phosphate synthase [Caldanaerobius fijiensis DSM 17918]
MIILMKPDYSEKDLENVCEFLARKGLNYHISKGTERTIVGIIGDKKVLEGYPVELLPGVEKAVPIVEPYKLVNRSFKPQPTVVDVDGVKIGGDDIVLIAGPCAVESREQLMITARAVKDAGARMLRGGVFKPRTSPYSFQGLQWEGLEYMVEAREELGLKIVTEVVNTQDVERVAEKVDMLQIGARNMQNFQLLREVGKSGKPVLLKRGLASTIEEWLNAAEYIMAEGNPNVVLCERGIRTFETYTRNTLDLSAVPVIKSKSHLPIIVDPSHGTGRRDLIKPMAMAAIAAGADGLIIEVHPDPKSALSDGPQSLKPDEFDDLVKSISKIAEVLGRRISL